MKKEKKGELNIYIIIIILFIFIIFVALSSYKEVKLKNNSCEKLGFEKYKYENNFKFCEDNRGNLYFVESECDYFLAFYPLSCKVKEISVGEVRVLK